MAELLSRMSLKSEMKGENRLLVEVPPTRHDVIHPCDIYEDIAIAHGYNEIEKTIPHMSTIAAEVNSQDGLLTENFCKISTQVCVQLICILRLTSFRSTSSLTNCEWSWRRQDSPKL